MRPAATQSTGGAEPECLAAMGRFAGFELRDPLGRRIGRVSRVFPDGDGSPAHVEVALGPLAGRTVLVPVYGFGLDEAQRVLVLKRTQRT